MKGFPRVLESSTMVKKKFGTLGRHSNAMVEELNEAQKNLCSDSCLSPALVLILRRVAGLRKLKLLYVTHSTKELVCNYSMVCPLRYLVVEQGIVSPLVIFCCSTLYHAATYKTRMITRMNRKQITRTINLLWNVLFLVIFRSKKYPFQ